MKSKVMAKIVEGKARGESLHKTISVSLWVAPEDMNLIDNLIDAGVIDPKTVSSTEPEGFSVHFYTHFEPAKIFAGFYGENQCFEYRGVSVNEKDFDPIGEYDRVEQIEDLFPSQSTKLRRRIEDALRKNCSDMDLIRIAEQVGVKTSDL
jgi:hypothetical protein